MDNQVISPNGKALKTLRQRRLISKANVAKLGDINATTVTYIEGSAFCRPDTMAKYLRGLGVSPQEAFEKGYYKITSRESVQLDTHDEPTDVIPADGRDDGCDDGFPWMGPKPCPKPVKAPKTKGGKSKRR
jgi:hypothetical protein